MQIAKFTFEHIVKVGAYSKSQVISPSPAPCGVATGPGSAPSALSFFVRNGRKEEIEKDFVPWVNNLNQSGCSDQNLWNNLLTHQPITALFGLELWELKSSGWKEDQTVKTSHETVNGTEAKRQPAGESVHLHFRKSNYKCIFKLAKVS